ncbi:MAG TPA: gamma-glutamylcyclotransferase [Ktedonobacteraceae bacterium]|nr:gamma-glutamylcyclotransferase [Ktedonobacteraceae bacterium]
MEEKYETSAEQAAIEDQRDNVSEAHSLAPGVPIVRTNTPRPVPFDLASDKTELPLAPSRSGAEFPQEAPEAPPVPEGSINPVEVKTDARSRLTSEGMARPLTGEFLWLFEYALDMDPVRLNRPERLNGSAFAYGPARLKGYRLVFEGMDARSGQVQASLKASPGELGAEVWGVLYRVPRRFARMEKGETPLLDRVHSSDTFIPLEIQVCETYRQREVTCITYVSSEETQQRVYQLPAARRMPEPGYLKRLLTAARKQKLPASYLRTLEDLANPALPVATLPVTPPEQNTEPLPTFGTEAQMPEGAEKIALPAVRVGLEANLWETPYPIYLRRWLMVFAVYVCLLLVVALALLISQGAGFEDKFFRETFTPPGISWYVFLYGLLGGCISCIMRLGFPLRVHPPTFVVFTWFLRPFIGAFLGALAYLILNSGILVVSSQATQHFALCAVVCTLAGFCEGQFLLKKFSKNV